MSWRTDTDFIVNETGSVNVTIKSASYDHFVIPPTETETTIKTSTTVFIYPNSGNFRKEEKGQIIESTHTMYVSDTSSVNVGHRVYESGSVNFYEVLQKRKYTGHIECDMKEVKGR